MVEVFKTNVQDIAESKRIVGELLVHLPGNRINFDLSDCDRILRVEGEDIPIETIIQLVSSVGYYCEVLV
jgi:hypothetical protein